MGHTELLVSVGSLSELLAWGFARVQNRPLYVSNRVSDFQPDSLLDKRRLEKLQRVCQKYPLLKYRLSPIRRYQTAENTSVKFCATGTGASNAKDNLLTEAVRLLDLTEQTEKDDLVPTPESTPFPLSFPQTYGKNCEVNTFSHAVMEAQQLVLICYLDENYSAQQVLASLPEITSGGHRPIKMHGIVFISVCPRPPCLETEIPGIWVRCRGTSIYARSIVPGVIDAAQLGKQPIFSHVSRYEDNFVLCVECFESKELLDLIAWSIDQFFQHGATGQCLHSRPRLTRAQPRTNETNSTHNRGIDHALGNLDVHQRWWSVLALSWIVFAEKSLDRKELLSALAAEREHRRSQTSNSVFKGFYIDIDEDGLISILRESLIISEDGGSILSPQEAEIALLRTESELGGINKGDVHEMIAYTCLRHIKDNCPSSLLQPWTAIKTDPGSRSASDGLLGYATATWQVHFRHAQRNSRRLSSLLHETIILAISGVKEHAEKGHDAIDVINVGMWLCAVHDFGILGRTYLEMGAEVSAVSWPHMSPLHAATSNSSLTVLELILAREPELDMVDCDGTTALQMAVFHGHLAATKMLLDGGSDVNMIFPSSGETALHVATRGGHETIVALLLRQGADINASSNLCETALSIALHEGHHTIAKMLVASNTAPPTSTDMGYSTSEATRAFHTLSLAEHDALTPRDLPHYVLHESSMLDIRLRYQWKTQCPDPPI